MHTIVSWFQNLSFLKYGKQLFFRILDCLIRKLGLIKPMQENPHLTGYIDCFYDPWYGDEIDHFWEEF